MGKLATICALALAVVGCSFGANYDGTRFRCDDGVCPAGYECVESVCVDEPGNPDGPDADTEPPSDGAGTDPDAEPTPAGPCGTTARLRDEFDDGATDDKWGWAWTDPGTSRAEIDGELVLSVTTAANNSAGYGSNLPYDLRDSVVELEVSAIAGDYTVLEIRDDDGGLFQLAGYVDQLAARSGGIKAQIPYDPVAHRFWRFRSDGSLLLWEVSPDRVSWSELYSETVSAQLQFMRVLFFAGGAVGQDVQARFASINPDGNADEPWCPTRDLADEFATGQRAVQWDNPQTSGDCTVSQTAGALELVVGTGGGSCGYRSRAAYSLAESSVAVEVGLAATDPAVSTYLTARSLDEREGVEIVRDDRLRAIYINDGVRTELAAVDYDATAHRHWRLGHAGNELLWQVSADGTSWQELASATTTMDVATLRVQLGVDSDGAPAAPATSRFESLY